MLGKQKCYPLCVLSLHLSQEVSDCVMKARLTGVQSKDAHYSQYTLQSSFTLYVHFPPDVGNIDGPIDLKVVEIAPAFQLDPHLRDRLHADAVNLARQVRMLYPYSPPPPRCSCPDVKTASTFGRGVCSADCESRLQCVECAALSLEHLL